MIYTFAADDSFDDGPASTTTMGFVADASSWGGGTITVSIYDNDQAGWVPVYTDTADFKQEIVIGKGNRYQVSLSGSTIPTSATISVFAIR